MYPNVNETIIVEIPTENKSYVSTIAEVQNEEILITYPIIDGTIQTIPLNTSLEISYIFENNRFKFTSEIIGRLKDQISLYRIRKPKEEEIQKIQYRDNFRVLANLKIVIKKKELTTINISGGGVLFKCLHDYDLTEGEIVTGNLLIPISSDKLIESIPFKAKVVRILLQNDTKIKQVGIAFTSIDERQRMKIIQYCIQKQRQDRMMKRE